MPNKFSKKNKVKKVKNMYGGLICPNPSNKAFIMLGHSATNSEILDVPDNCVYITTTMCGNFNYIPEIERFMEFFEKNRELVKNPCSYSNFEAINQFVSENSESDYYIGNIKTNYTTSNPKNSSYLNMHISRTTCVTSAKCPKHYLFLYKNAMYIPCLYWFYKKLKLYEGPNVKYEHDRINFESSGLISSDNVFDHIFSTTIKRISPWKHPMVTIKDIEEIYKYSVYPKFDDILAKITELNIQRNLYLEITDSSDEKYIDINDSIYDKYIISGFDFVELIERNFTKTQSELFIMFPGVYYNTACRGFHEPLGDVVDTNDLKQFLRQISVDNKKNLLDLYTEEDKNGLKEEEEREIAQREEAKEREEREIAQREEQELLQAKEISSVGEPPIFNYPQLGKWFGRAGKNKKTRRIKRSKKYYKNKTRQNNKYKNKNKTKKKKIIH